MACLLSKASFDKAAAYRGILHSVMCTFVPDILQNAAAVAANWQKAWEGGEGVVYLFFVFF